MKKIIAMILAITLCLSFIGCKEAIDAEKGNKGDKESVEVSYEPRYGGNMNVPISNVKTFNPLVNKEKSLYYFYKLIYEPLFVFDENFNVKGQLCQSYSIQNEGRTIKLSLRNDVYWHDGKKFTARDVKFTIDALRMSAKAGLYTDLLSDVFKPANLSEIKQIISANVINDSTIEIKLNRNYSNSLEALMFPILPMHQFTNGKAQTKSSLDNAFNENFIKTPVGTGPYKFMDYKKLKEIKLGVNEKWYGMKPYIQTITGKIVDTDETALASFETGLVDVAFAIGIDWDKYLENKEVDIYNYITNKYEFLAFNFNNPLFQGDAGISLRKAIAFAINKKTIVNNVFLGHAQSASTPINPESWLYDESNEKYEYNISKAKDILNKAGFKDTNGDGIIEDASGKKVKIRILTNSYNKVRADMADRIIADLKEIGIEVVKDYKDVENPPKETITKAWQDLNTKIKQNKFDMLLLGWDLSLVPDFSFMLHSSQIDNGTNFIKYNSGQMDNLLANAFLATNRETKKQAYSKLQKLISQDLPYVSLLFKKKAILVNDKVKGEIKPTVFNLYNNIEKWFIPNKEK
ncbi:peptide ABC transporter substrate-binding protein [Clostridiaceae bacterium M8S5]|nr:peptide ABC transporter substrate-binding protein [Clostridiaceae bacterium M8S5]